MDSNGTKFQLLANADDFRTGRGDTCIWDEHTQVFRLEEQQQPRLATVSIPNALSAWENASPLIQDAQKQLGFLSPDARQLHYSLTWPITAPRPVLATNETNSGTNLEEITLDPVDAPEGAEFVDVHLGGDGRAALPYTNGTDQHGLLVVHLGRRWQSRCRLVDAPKRAWVDHLNRAWVAADNWVAMCSGEPLPQPYFPDPRRFEPVNVNPNPLQRRWRQALPAGYTLLAMTADTEHLYLLMTHNVDRHQQLFVRSLDDNAEAPIRRMILPSTLFAIDLAAMSAGRLALMLARENDDSLDLPVIDVPELGETVHLLARRYPQYNQDRPRFVTGELNVVRYLSSVGPKQLHRLPQARFAHAGQATLNRILDSGEPDALWHRVYIDACIPPGCALELHVKAFDSFDAPGSDWQAQPTPLWQPIASELPFYESRFQPNANGQEGLFEILLQREEGAVREVHGRYLQLRIVMRGDGRHSPAIAAMRVYHPRFSWQQAYLPTHFHQQERPEDTIGAANGADVRERMFASFEGVMTPIEDQIAASECLLSPQATPSEHLNTLASMVGAQNPAGWPTYRKRHWVQFQTELQQQRGTFSGLCLALDIATDGALSKGQVVPVENYRLRRTLATILGIDMNDDAHPLTLGTGQSGNSIVGESLILSDGEAREFLALFAPELSDTELGRTGLNDNSVDQQTVEAFFDHYAFTLSVIIHSDARPLRETVRQVLAEYLPAHLNYSLIDTDHPFVLGLSPLLGIDTYLERQPAWRDIILNDIYLGREGLLRNPATLSPTHASARTLSTQGDQA